MDVILAALQNGVQAINNLNNTLRTVFPGVTAVSTAARGAVGSITFTSSQATTFFAVTTSSGYTGWVPMYPSS